MPLFLEKCVAFIEVEGLDSEGIYRVPGNKVHVEQLTTKFKEGNLCVRACVLVCLFFMFFFLVSVQAIVLIRKEKIYILLSKINGLIYCLFPHL